MPLPDKPARENMIKLHIPPKRSKELNYEEYADVTDGYSGSDIKSVCKEAAMRQLRKILHKLEYEGLRLGPDSKFFLVKL